MLTELLDLYLTNLQAKGYVGSADRPGPSRESVRTKLQQAGYGTADELVEFFTWVDFPPPGGSFDTFWETASPLGIDYAIAAGQANRASKQQGGDNGDEYWPGPDQRLPMLYLDGTEFVAVDTNEGSVWFTTIESPSFEMFGSLSEAVRTAIYCVQADLWIVEGGWEVVCDRDSVPSPDDLTNPPWAI